VRSVHGSSLQSEHYLQMQRAYSEELRNRLSGCHPTDRDLLRSRTIRSPAVSQVVTKMCHLAHGRAWRRCYICG
jgi:hypothetical protein